MRATPRPRPGTALTPRLVLSLAAGLLAASTLGAQEAAPVTSDTAATAGNVAPGPFLSESFGPGLREHVPVLLVPGWNDEGEDLAPLRRRFLDAGWPEERVVALGFEDPVGSNVEHAAEIAVAVEELRTATGAPAVDVVAHSMGGLAVRRLLLEGDPPIRKVVFLATPHRGTVTAYMAWGEGGEEMQPGAEFLLDLNRELLPHRNVRAMSVRTPMDLRIIPGESAQLPGAVNREVCCPTHRGLLEDPETFELVRGFLEARWTPVPVVAGEGGERDR